MRALSILLVLLIGTLGSFSQVNSLSLQNLSTVNVDQVPDEEIKMYWQKAKDNGLTDQNIYRLLLEKGMPESEISKLNSRIEKLATINSNNSRASETQANQTPVKERFSEQDGQVPMQRSKTDLSVYGSELFTETSLVFEPNLRIPTPAGYILGPDDELVINVFGFSEKTYNVAVNEEGNIYIPQVGPIFLNGLSIEQASAKIKNKLASTIYKAIGSGQTRVQISLGKIRSIRVTVIGEAKKPGTYTVSSLTTLFNILYLCGGPSDLGSYRTIELIRGNELKRSVDLYAFLTRGDQKDNVLLQEGDVIRIPYYTARISLNGSIKHKGKYEVLSGETFNDVLKYSGGFADDAYKASVTIYQFTDTERKIADLQKRNYESYKPSTGDSIVVGKLLNRYANKLTITGAVLRPGEYELENGSGLKDLIKKAGGLKEDVYLKRGSISRIDENGLSEQLSFDIDSVMTDKVTIALKRSDSVNIYSIFDIQNEASISIEGEVNKPGKYKWAKSITLKDLLLTAGGATEAGDVRNIEIARRIDNINLNTLNHLQTEIISVNLEDSVSYTDIALQPFDVINVRQKPEYAKQRTVTVDGMVINPGRYTLKMSGDRISDVIKRAGGFRANADTSALIIKRLVKTNQTNIDREKVFSKLLNIKEDSLNSSSRMKNEIYKEYDKISINLTTALTNPNSTENMLLEEGDILTIEPNTNLVKVSGEVYFPTIVPFEKGASLKYYIQKSGSFTDQARKSGTLVIYPDGKAKKVKKFLFFRSYPEVVARAEIFVPQKSDRNKQRFTVAEWSVLVSSLAIISNVIVNLSK